jgi:hypothetical protein
MGEEGGCKPEELIRGGQGLAEGYPKSSQDVAKMESQDYPVTPYTRLPVCTAKTPASDTRNVRHPQDPQY